MIGSTDRSRGVLAAPARRKGWKLSALVAFVAVGIGAVSAAAGVIVPEAPEAERLAATFEARAVADPTIGACRALPAIQKLDGRYGGTMTVAGEEYGIHFVLEALVDRAAGLGSAEGQWQLTDLRTGEVVGRGELVATVTADPPGESEPVLELQGLLLGATEPAEPELQAQRLVGNFTASLGDGATFPHLKGTLGDPAGLDSNPAVLLPAVKC